MKKGFSVNNGLQDMLLLTQINQGLAKNNAEPTHIIRKEKLLPT